MIYNKTMLLKQIFLFNQKAKSIKDYEIDIKETGIIKVPYQLVMLTEEENKHKFAGTIKECFNFIERYLQD